MINMKRNPNFKTQPKILIEKKKPQPESIDIDEIGDEIDAAVKELKKARTTPTVNMKYFELKIVAEQVCRKYMGTKKRWLDPKHQQEADYLLCMKLLELCK
jgi:hypothetical protein